MTRRLLSGVTVAAWRGIIRANNRMNSILVTIKGELAAQSASSAHGRRGRVHALREVRWWRRGNRTIRRCYREGRRAVRQFKAVGLTSPVGPISET